MSALADVAIVTTYGNAQVCDRVPSHILGNAPRAAVRELVTNMLWTMLSIVRLIYGHPQPRVVRLARIERYPLHELSGTVSMLRMVLLSSRAGWRAASIGRRQARDLTQALCRRIIGAWWCCDRRRRIHVVDRSWSLCLVPVSVSCVARVPCRVFSNHMQVSNHRPGSISVRTFGKHAHASFDRVLFKDLHAPPALEYRIVPNLGPPRP